MLSRFTDKTQTFGRMIKFSHSIFALPFALSAVVLAWKDYTPSALDILWILIAMVSARSAAMGFNRIVDAAIDKKNPRTAIREIPAGILSKKEAVLFVGLSSLIFVGAAAMLSSLCFWLSFPVLAALFFYSYTKRFTSLCHVYLGFAISLAPVGAWVALTGALNWGIIFLGAALWTHFAAFDILYACQDMDFDREQGLFSLPAKLGAKKAMKISWGLHAATLIFFLSAYFSFAMHPVFLLFLGAIALLLIVEHLLVKPDDLSRVHVAFFHINSVVSILLLAGVITQSLF